MTTLKLPFSVFNYSSYKEFLLDAYEHSHKMDESISYELLSTHCQLKTRTQAKNIIKGVQAPTLEQLLKLAQFFNLSDKESKYLVCLFKFQDTKSSPVAFELFEQLMQMQKAENGPKANPFKDIEVMTSVIHMSLLSILEFNTKVTIEEMTLMLKSRYSGVQVEEAINDLIELQYINFNQTTNNWELQQKHIRKYDQNANIFLRKFHNECLDLAKDSLNNETTQDRYLIGASFAINHKVFPRIIQKVNAFVENLMMLDNVGGTPDMVVQYNSQLIKMTKIEESKTAPGLGLNKTEGESDLNLY